MAVASVPKEKVEGDEADKVCVVTVFDVDFGLSLPRSRDDSKRTGQSSLCSGNYEGILSRL